MKSLQVVPASEVFQTWPVPPVKPITVTKAVSPVASDVSITTLETGKWLGLIFCVTSVNAGVPAVALVVTQTCPPEGDVPVCGPKPSVVA